MLLNYIHRQLEMKKEGCLIKTSKRKRLNGFQGLKVFSGVTITVCFWTKKEDFLVWGKLTWAC